jgi:hypothetical protein
MTMPDISSLWPKAVNESPPNPGQAAGALLRAFSELLGVELIEFAQVGGVAVFLCDLSPLGYAQMSMNVVMVTHPPRDDAEARDQAGLLLEYKNAVKSVGFCFHLLLREDFPGGRPPGVSSPDVVFMCGADLRRMFASDAPHSVFFETVRRQVQLQNLCPFDTTHEARGSMFRGRRAELNRLVTHLDTQFVVSGARRIGKTSLLKRAYESLWRRAEFRPRTYYFNCITWGGHWDCFDRLAHQIDPKRETRIEKGLRNVSYMLERSSLRGSRPLLLFFDETDRVIDTDAANGWRFFNVLAEAVGAHWVRVVFAGYRSMARLALGKEGGPGGRPGRSETPFLDCLEPISLRPLARSEASSLLAEPFRVVGIPIRREDAVLDRVWQGTVGYPFLVQFYGEQLFQTASERSPQEVRPEDVDALENSFELSDFLESHFIQNTIDHWGPVASERVCAFLLAHRKEDEPWTKGHFLEACRKSGHDLTLDEIDQALRNLYHANILSFEAGCYTYVLPLLRTILKRSFPDLPTLLNALDRR